MDIAIGLLFLVTGVFILMGIFGVIKRNGKAKRNFLLSGACFILMIVLASISIANEDPAAKEVSTTEKSDDSKKSKKVENKTLILLVDKVEDVPLNQESITLTGTTNQASKVSINGIDTVLNEDGSFSYEITGLKEGENKISVVANAKEGADSKTENIVVNRVNPPIALALEGKTESDSKVYEIVGSTEPKVKVVAYKDDKEVGKATSDGEGFFGIKVDTEKEGDYTFVVKASNEEFSESEEKVVVTRVLSKAEKAQAKKEKLKAKRSKAKSIEYKRLEKNPDRYKGEYVKYTGQIIQIQEGDDMTAMRLSVSKDSWGWSAETVVWVEYAGLTDFIEDDVVTIYGDIYGSYEYTSQAGWEISIPGIIAESIE